MFISCGVTTVHVLRQRDGYEVTGMAKASGLTNQLIEAVRLETGERWLSDDDGGRGGGRLAVRVRPDERRLFYFRYSLNGNRIAIPLGPYARSATPGYLTLEEARAIARRYSVIYRDPRTRDVRAHLAATSPDSESVAKQVPTVLPSESPEKVPTVLDVCNSYLADLLGRKAQSAKDVASNIRVHVEPTQWASIPASKFTAPQAADLLRKIIQGGSFDDCSARLPDAPRSIRASQESGSRPQRAGERG